MDALYTPEQMRQFAEVAAATPPEEIAAIEQEWTVLLAKIRASRDLDPASPAAQALGERWETLTARTMRGYEQAPELREAISANYDRGAFAGDERAPQAADFAFIERIKAARTSDATSQ